MKYTLTLLAAMLAIAPGCHHKCRKDISKSKYLEHLEQEHAKYKTRGIALTTTAPIAIASGTAAGVFVGREFIGCGLRGEAGWCIAAAVGVIACTAVIVGGFYMLGQGIHDLAKSKRLRRMRMKEEAQARRLARENARIQQA